MEKEKIELIEDIEILDENKTADDSINDNWMDEFTNVSIKTENIDDIEIMDDIFEEKINNNSEESQIYSSDFMEDINEKEVKEEDIKDIEKIEIDDEDVISDISVKNSFNPIQNQIEKIEVLDEEFGYMDKEDNTKTIVFIAALFAVLVIALLLIPYISEILK